MRPVTTPDGRRRHRRRRLPINTAHDNNNDTVKTVQYHGVLVARKKSRKRTYIMMKRCATFGPWFGLYPFVLHRIDGEILARTGVLFFFHIFFILFFGLAVSVHSSFEVGTKCFLGTSFLISHYITMCI